MNASIAVGAWRPIVTCIALCIVLSLPLRAQMQTFEYTYGGTGCIEEGFRGVERVDLPGGCCQGGYIAVGASSESVSSRTCTYSNVYVVRTDATGAHMWEFVYDLGGMD